MGVPVVLSVGGKREPPPSPLNFFELLLDLVGEIFHLGTMFNDGNLSVKSLLILMESHTCAGFPASLEVPPWRRATPLSSPGMALASAGVDAPDSEADHADHWGWE